MPRSYVDNAMNRSLGRVGMPLGSAVHSRSGGGGGGGFGGGGSSFSGASTTRSYVDNSMNRSLGRVGMPVGSAVHSRSGGGGGGASYNGSRSTASASFSSVSVGYQSSSGSSNTYVDNAMNRNLNRVGLERGTAVHSTKNEAYRDTPLNRELGRVGKPWGTCPQNKNKNPYKNLLEEDPDCLFMDLPEDYEDDGDYRNNPSGFGYDWNEEIEKLEVARENVDSEDVLSEYYTESKYARDRVEPGRRRIDYHDLIIKRKIGHGGFGEVFIASLNGELFAVKKPLISTLSKRRMKQFKDEVALFCTLEHENIVKFFGACFESGNLAIIMELMDMSLFDALHVHQIDFTQDSKVQIFQGTASGLDYLHAENIAHCDIKTQNILLNNVPGLDYYDSQKPVVAKITDFGLSLMKADTTTTVSMSAPVKNAGPMGTPRYSAPEILRGEILNIDQFMMADVYSLALVVFETAVEEPPFEDLNLIQLQKHVGEKGHRPSMPQNLVFNKKVESLLKRCWNYQPKHRPSAQDMREVAYSVTYLVKEDEE